MKCYVTMKAVRVWLMLNLLGTASCCYLILLWDERFYQIWIAILLLSNLWTIAKILRLAIGKKMLLEITEEGLSGRRVRRGKISWKDVRTVGIVKFGFVQAIALTMRNEREWLAELSLWHKALFYFNKLVGEPHLTINCVGLQPGVDEIWQQVSQFAEVNSSPKASVNNEQ